MRYSLSFIFCPLILLTMLPTYGQESRGTFTGNSNSNIRFSVHTERFILRKDERHHLAFPDVLKLGNDSLMVVYRQGLVHIDSHSVICRQFGSPDGTQWTQADTLIDIPNIDDRDPSLELLQNGQVWINYFQYVNGIPSLKPTLFHNFGSLSNDNGRSFQKFKQIDSGKLTYRNTRISKKGIWVRRFGKPIYMFGSSSSAIEYQGKLMLPAYGGYPLVTQSGTKDFRSPASTISLYTSKNNGETWKPNPVYLPGSDTVWLQEPALINLGDSLLLMHVRTANGKSAYNNGKLAQTISRDGGKTWSKLEFFDYIAHAPELFQLSSGVLISGIRLIEKQAKVAFIYSTDQGKSWSKPEIIEYCKGECGYPAMAELRDNQLLFVYYNDEAHAIKAVIYNFQSRDQ